MLNKTAGAVALLFLAIAPARAQTVTLDLIDEYPASSVAGEADAFFAEAVKRRAGGRIVINPIPDAKSGLRSREQLKAVTEGKFAMANSVGGTLGAESPVFLMSSLPFVTPTLKDARALSELSLAQYEQAFAERSQKLLYVVPWPPSGVWSAAALDGVAALKALKIRTYDQTGTEVLAKVATSATLVSFSDLDPRLESGEINAVLSSGDGGAGRQLWKYLRHFSNINYAVPLSFGSISLAVWESLDEAGRAALLDAGRETTERSWALLETRLTQNYERMRANGVTIDETPPAGVMAALREAAAQSLAAWQDKASPDAKAVLAAFLAGKH